MMSSNNKCDLCNVALSEPLEKYCTACEDRIAKHNPYEDSHLDLVEGDVLKIPIVYPEIETLTRRDRFAMAAMQSIYGGSYSCNGDAAKGIVALADALIKELDK